MENTKEETVNKQSQPMTQGKTTDGSGCESLDSAIIHHKLHVASLEKLRGLREAARPLMEYLQQNHHPHCSAVVDTVRVEILEGQVQVQF